MPQTRKESLVWLASIRSLTTPAIAPAFAAVKRSFAGSRISIDGKGSILRRGLNEREDGLFGFDKAGEFPEVNKDNVHS